MSKRPNFAPLFELLNEERDDFPFLVEKYRIDPGSDLRHSDLGGVDFGALHAKTLDLLLDAI